MESQGNMERVGIRKSGCVELDSLRKGTERVNTVLRLCRGLGTAQSFFESKDSLASLPLAWMAWALALEADDEDFRQSFAEWLGAATEHAQGCCRSSVVFPAGLTFCLCQACQRWM